MHYFSLIFLKSKRIRDLSNKSIKFNWNNLLELYSIKSVESIDEVVFLSYYQKNIKKEIINSQKAVFNYLEIELIQCESEMSHGDFLTTAVPLYLDKKLIVCFDVDCVPLSKYAIISILKDIDDERTLAGAIQTANHKLEGKNIYIGPFFMAFSSKLFRSLRPIDFNEDSSHDVGGQITSKCLENGFNVKYWFPTDVQIPKWYLYPNGYFGIGTTYNGLVFHNFEIRKNLGISFKKMCSSILRGSYQ